MLCLMIWTGGYKQAMAGTISLLNRDGDRLHTIYVGSAPESGKKTFLRKMRKELSAVIKSFPRQRLSALLTAPEITGSFSTRLLTGRSSTSFTLPNT